MGTFLGIAFWSGLLRCVLRGSVLGQGLGGYVFRDSVLVRFRGVRFGEMRFGSRFWRVRFERVCFEVRVRWVRFSGLYLRSIFRSH